MMVSLNIKKLTKLILFICLFFFSLILTSCDDHPQKQPNVNDQNTIFPGEFKGIAKNQKIYLTSFGQAKEVEDLNLFLFKTSEIDYIQDNKLDINDVTEGSIVFAVVGCSIKGLEAQNTTKDAEIIRCNDFIEANKSGKITLITWHLGGMARRGSTSDEIIKVALSGSAMTIYVESGNEDNYLTNVLTEFMIPAYAISNITLLDRPINYLFNLSMEE